MTTLRRQRLSRRSMLCGLLFATGPVLLLRREARAASGAQNAADSGEGVALRGYDAVAYFNDRAARIGRADFKVSFGGATWHFESEDNRAVFADDPQSFTPQYGGHDPMRISDNMASAGQPDVFAIHNERLYLFATEGARDQFLSDPDNAVLEADVNWPHVSDMAAR